MAPLARSYMENLKLHQDDINGALALYPKKDTGDSAISLKLNNMVPSISTVFVLFCYMAGA